MVSFCSGERLEGEGRLLPLLLGDASVVSDPCDAAATAAGAEDDDGEEGGGEEETASPWLVFLFFFCEVLARACGLRGMVGGVLGMVCARVTRMGR